MQTNRQCISLTSSQVIVESWLGRRIHRMANSSAKGFYAPRNPVVETDVSEFVEHKESKPVNKAMARGETLPTAISG
jgi:predicted membrane-bound mannosyltransferase